MSTPTSGDDAQEIFRALSHQTLTRHGGCLFGVVDALNDVTGQGGG
jgi:hypothetical protein